MTPITPMKQMASLAFQRLNEYVGMPD